MGTQTLTAKQINKNFRIKVNGRINGRYVSKLVGIKGLLELLGQSMERLMELVQKAYNSMADKWQKKLYNGPKITFYAK